MNSMQHKNKQPRNDKALAHGLWEMYYDNGNLYYRRHYINGEKIGFWERYFPEIDIRFYAR